MIEKIKSLFTRPDELAFMVSGLGLLAFYYFYARQHLHQRQIKPSSNSMLKMTIRQLLKSQPPNICKIVITESSPVSTQFKSRIVTRLKQFLNSENLPALVNCAPLKLFRDSAETFVSTLTQDDAEDERDVMGYFESALRCQLIVERTVVDIHNIQNRDVKTYMICDTNSLDLKVNSNQHLWQKFLKQQKITESDLKKDYNIIFHIKGIEHTDPRFPTKNGYSDYYTMKKDFDERTTLTWRDSLNYHVIYYESYLMMEQNIEIALQHIVDCMRPFFEKNLSYRKRLVFTKEW